MRKSIYRIWGPMVALSAIILLAACVFVPAESRGPGVVIVPPLPAIVVLEQEPYYYQNGYYYHYNNNRWFYSRARSGPWADLPRGHYPKEIRYRGRDDDKGKGWKHDDDEGDRGGKRGHEDERRY